MGDRFSQGHMQLASGGDRFSRCSRQSSYSQDSLSDQDLTPAAAAAAGTSTKFSSSGVPTERQRYSADPRHLCTHRVSAANSVDSEDGLSAPSYRHSVQRRSLRAESVSLTYPVRRTLRHVRHGSFDTDGNGGGGGGGGDMHRQCNGQQAGPYGASGGGGGGGGSGGGGDSQCCRVSDARPACTSQLPYPSRRGASRSQRSTIRLLPMSDPIGAPRDSVSTSGHVDGSIATRYGYSPDNSAMDFDGHSMSDSTPTPRSGHPAARSQDELSSSCEPETGDPDGGESSEWSSALRRQQQLMTFTVEMSERNMSPGSGDQGTRGRTSSPRFETRTMEPSLSRRDSVKVDKLKQYFESSSSGSRTHTTYRKAHQSEQVVVQDDNVSEAGTYVIDDQEGAEGGCSSPVAKRQQDLFLEQQQQQEDTANGAEDGGIVCEQAGGCSSNVITPDNVQVPFPKSSRVSCSEADWIERWAEDVSRHNSRNMRTGDRCSSAAAGASAGTEEEVRRSHLTDAGAAGTTNPSFGSQTFTRSAARRRASSVTSNSNNNNNNNGSSRESPVSLRTPEESELRSSLRAKLISPAARSSVSSSSTVGRGGGGGGGGGANSKSSATKPHPVLSAPKSNRVISLRRARLGLDGDSAGNTGNSSALDVTRAARQQQQQRHSPLAGPPSELNMSRSDGGRFSLRTNHCVTSKPGRGWSDKGKLRSAGRDLCHNGAGGGGGGGSGGGSNDTTQQLANWQRRKNYNPLLAARASAAEKSSRSVTSTCTTASASASTAATSSATTTTATATTRLHVETRTPRSAVPLRSASFHGDSKDSAAVALAAPSSHHKHLQRGEQRGGSSGGDTTWRQSLPFQLQRRLSLGHDYVSAAAGGGAAGGAAADDDDCTDGATSHTFSTHGVVAKKALDSFVINTIHSLSTKMKANAESLVGKLKLMFDEHDVRHTLLDDTMCSLTAGAPPPPAAAAPAAAAASSHGTAGRAASRQLAAIVKSLRAVDQTIQVLEQVLCEQADTELSDVDDGELAALIQKINNENFN